MPPVILSSAIWDFCLAPNLVSREISCMRYARMSGTLQLHFSVNGSHTSQVPPGETGATLVSLVLSVIYWPGSDLRVLAQGSLVQIVDLYLHGDGGACSALGILVFMHSFRLRVRLPRTGGN